VRKTLQALARLTDEALRLLWQDAGFGPTLALLAVGGYGRGELFPSSDVDVLVLLPDHDDPEKNSLLKSSLEAFIGSCWDAGLEIGSSVRTTSECVAEAQNDVTVQTSLLEARLIDGDAALFAEFQRQYRASLNPKAFFTAKTLEQDVRAVGSIPRNTIKA
jgi:[protein-PII] uridylyltransferase